MFSINEFHIKATGNPRPEVKGRDQCFKSEESRTFRNGGIRITLFSNNWNRELDVAKGGNRRNTKEDKKQYLLLCPPILQHPVLPR